MFSADGGGAIRVAYSQALGLSKQGQQVFVFTGTLDDNSGWSEWSGIKIYRARTKESKYILRSYIFLFNPMIAREFKNFLRAVKPDVVHFHNLYYQFPISLIKIAKERAKGVFLTAHDAMLVNYGKVMPKNGNSMYKVSIWDQIKEARKRYNPFRNLIIRYYLKYVDKIFSVSNALKKLLEINGIKNVKTIYNGIDVDEWEINLEKVQEFKERYNLSNKRIVLFGGRLSGAKGGEVILRSLALVVKMIKNTTLVVAGEKGWYVKEMIRLVKDLGIGNNVKFTGRLNREDMIFAFFVSDICVTPSIYLDPFPTVNLEAMAAKKPVIGTCFGGTPEIVLNNETGYIVNPSNINELAEKMIDLLKNPQKANKFGEAGYERVKNFFSLENQVKEIFKWYNRFVLKL